MSSSSSSLSAKAPEFTPANSSRSSSLSSSATVPGFDLANTSGLCSRLMGIKESDHFPAEAATNPRLQQASIAQSKHFASHQIQPGCVRWLRQWTESLNAVRSDNQKRVKAKSYDHPLIVMKALQSNESDQRWLCVPLTSFGGMSIEQWLQIRATNHRFEYYIPISTDPECRWPSTSADGVSLPFISLVEGTTIEGSKQSYVKLDFTLDVPASELHPCTADSNNPRITPQSFSDLCSLIALPDDYHELYHGGFQGQTVEKVSAESSPASLQAWPVTSNYAPLQRFLKRLRSDTAKTKKNDIDRIFSQAGSDELVPLATQNLSKRQRRIQRRLAQGHDSPSEEV